MVSIRLIVLLSILCFVSIVNCDWLQDIKLQKIKRSIKRSHDNPSVVMYRRKNNLSFPADQLKGASSKTIKIRKDNFQDPKYHKHPALGVCFRSYNYCVNRNDCYSK